MARGELDGLSGGVIQWDDPLSNVDLFSAADGVVWTVPVEVTLPGGGATEKDPHRSGEVLILHGASGELRINRSSEPFLPIARTTIGPARPCRPGSTTIRLPFSLSSQALARVEMLRDGQSPVFEVVVQVSAQRSGPYVREPQDALPMLGHAMCRFRVEHSAWTEALRGVGACRNVLVELPLAASPRPGFEDVHQYLLEAIDELDRGGEIGWRGCAASIRHALDAWPNAPKGKAIQFEHGDGIHDRMVKLRQALREVTHPAHHGPSGDWTRADAVALLAATAGLLAREGG